MDSLENYGYLLSTKEVSEIMHLSTKTIRKLFMNQDIPGIKIGGSWFCPKQKFQEIFERESLLRGKEND